MRGSYEHQADRQLSGGDLLASPVKRPVWSSILLGGATPMRAAYEVNLTTFSALRGDHQEQ